MSNVIEPCPTYKREIVKKCLLLVNAQLERKYPHIDKVKTTQKLCNCLPQWLVSWKFIQLRKKCQHGLSAFHKCQHTFHKKPLKNNLETPKAMSIDFDSFVFNWLSNCSAIVLSRNTSVGLEIVINFIF